MNKSLLLSVILFVFAVQTHSAQNWMKGTISGEGDVVKKEISLAAMDGINLVFSGDVVLMQGNTQKVIVEGQQNIIDNIKREVKNGTWIIANEKQVKNAKMVTIYITLPKLEEVALSGSGAIKSKGKFTGLSELEVSVVGSGNINLEYDSKATDLQISGSGEITLAGSTGEFNVNISGSGDVNASNLASTSCHVNISGSGDAAVKVNGELKSNISGSGDVRYAGNANVTAKVSGSGTVSKM
jgi:hypothetical protein